MDCEKFENLLIDELYGELDEVTSAAVRRHAAGCARCGALLSGLRATRKVAALPVEEPSEDLEDRILSAVREQQKVLPFRARFAMAVSRAGAWAMRPQTAMAAVFLVVIGTSFVLVQSRKSAAPMAANAEGSPFAAQAAPTTAAASAFALDNKESSFAHGTEEKKLEQRAAPAATVAQNEPVDGLLDKDKSDDRAKNGDLVANAATIAGADTTALGQGRAGGSGGGGAGPGWSSTPSAEQPVAPTGGAFRANPNASLLAGRAERAKTAGCSQAALSQFESARTRAPAGSQVANDATLEAARCYRALGDTGNARARYSTLLGQQAYAAIAQNELNQMAPAATRKAAPMHAAPHAVATATTTPQAAPPAQNAQKAAESY